ncbi:YfhO family protein [Paenibacillus sp. FSL H8-0332]|uniref:YfhO family protein n=1 Tax=Paenibacillus sp. FSL H8-0332 TaxID=2954742 RepID=UPI0030D39A24
MERFYSKLPKKIAFITMIISVIIIYSPLLFGMWWLKWDTYDALFSVMVSLSNHIKHGDLPLWEFYQFRGIPLSHLLGGPIWSPLTLLLGFIGYSQYVLQVQFVLIAIIASMGVYLATGNYCSSKWVCSALGVAYATCGLFIGNAQHITFIAAAALIPFVQYFYQLWVRTSDKRNVVFLGAFIGLLVLNSYPVFVVFILLVLFIEFLFDIGEYRGKFTSISLMLKNIFYSLFIFVVVVLGSSLVTLVSTIEAMNLITRSSVGWGAATINSLSFENLIGLISPKFNQLSPYISNADVSMTNMYISLPITLFICITRFSKKNIKLIFLVLLTLSLSLGKNLFIYKMVYSFIPFVDTFRFPAGLRFLFFFYLIMLVASSLSSIDLYYEKYKQLLLTSSLLILIILAQITFLKLFVNLKFDLPSGTRKELFFSLIILIFYYISIKKSSKNCADILFFTFVLIFSFQGVFSNGTYTLGTKDRPTSYTTAIENMYNSPGKISVLNKYIDSKPFPVAFPYTVYSQQFQNGGYIGGFELKNFNSAYSLNLLPQKDDPVLWSSINNEDRISPDYIYVNGNKIGGDFYLDKSGVVGLTQSYFKGWNVKVDGTTAPLKINEDGTMGVLVNKGSHKVEFEFSPQALIISFYITIFVWFTLLLYALKLIPKFRFKLN